MFEEIKEFEENQKLKGPEIAPELVSRFLRAFPKETAPGPWGLRIVYLKEACVAGGSEALMTQLTAVVSLLSQGRAPAFVASVLAGAGLVALPKPNGGVRPIAVGEILRRLAGKYLMSLVREDAQSYFWPAQVGVAVPGGAEKAIHTVRAWRRRHWNSPHKVALKLDFSNAFNTVSRAAVLSAVSEHFPSLSRWATWCYQRPTRLQFADWVVESKAGVQQGDPLGPLFFPAAIQPLAQDLRNTGLDLAVHYLDDGILAGDVAAVSQALRLVEARAANIGLILNLAKSELVAVGAVDIAALHCHFPDSLLRDTGGASKVQRNFELLGAAIGNDAFVRAYTAERAARAGDLFDSLGEMEDPQTMALDMFDGMLRRSFGDFTGLHLTAEQWIQASLGLAQGGLGLRSTSRHAAATFLASRASTLTSAAELDGGFSIDEAKACPDVCAALAAFNTHLPPSQAIALDAALAHKQKALSTMLDSAAWDTQLAQSAIAGRTTLLSEASIGGRAFLNALPSGRMQMEPVAFLSELRVRLQVPDATSDTWCPLRDAVLDHHSHHAGTHTAAPRGDPRTGESVCTAAAAETHARHKELHLRTAQACEQQGVKFVPMVAECTGAWDPSTLKVLKFVAHAVAAKIGEEPAACYNQLLQELGATIRSFRARAALRRRFEAT
ncbi:Retrotransposable element SLACS 132 kDa protein (ORF2) [Includes: Reverse transcriptase] [Durusdinium trenchii]|uniref:Retrotransposable element SLACS 132 kDa protein (ORF2) n=1 Tax=Durusdinium trenchii TaxID=1381693 RepID=A0ABP0K922_9DINO